MDKLFYKIHSKRSIQAGNQLCEFDVSTVVEKNKEEGKAELSKSTAFTASDSHVEYRNVLPLESGLYTSEMMTRAV